MLRAQAIADIGVAEAEPHVLSDKGLIHTIGLNNVVGDEVEDRQIGLRREDETVVRQVIAAMLIGREHRDIDMWSGEATVGDPGPEDRMHFRHVRAPEHERVCFLNVVITPHRLIDAEGPDETGNGGGHAVTGVRVDVVGAEACLVELGGSIAFPDCPLAGAEHSDRRHLPAVAGLGNSGLELLRHDVEGLIPTDLVEFAVLVVLAVRHPQQRFGQSVGAIENLGKEVPFHTVEAAIDLCLGVAVSGYDAAILDANHDRASGAAEAAGCF